MRFSEQEHDAIKQALREQLLAEAYPLAQGEHQRLPAGGTHLARMLAANSWLHAALSTFLSVTNVGSFIQLSMLIDQQFRLYRLGRPCFSN